MTTNFLAGLIITGGAANLKDLDEVLRKRSKIEKVRNARFVRNTIHADEDVVKKDGTQNTLFGLLIAGNENCCLLETPAPQPHIQPQPQPEPVNMFEEDESLKEQEALPALPRRRKKKKRKSGKKKKSNASWKRRKEGKKREEINLTGLNRLSTNSLMKFSLTKI